MATKGKDEFDETTPISKKLQKLASESSHIGIVTGSPVINKKKKKRSTKHHTNTHRSSSGGTSSVAKGKDEFDKTTPISKKLQKLASESSHIGIVTGSPVINKKKKKRSTKHHTNTHRSSSGGTSSVACKLESNETITKVTNNNKKRSSKSPLDSDTSSVSSSEGTSSVTPRKIEFDKTTNKVPKDKKDKLSGDTPSVACMLESDKKTTKVVKNKKKRSSKSLSYGDTSSVSSSDDASSVARKPESDKTTTKAPKKKKKRSSKSLSRGDTPSKTPSQTMFCAYQIDWTNSSVTRNEIRKYTNADHIDDTQEAILPYLLNKFKPNDIKTSFAALISKSNRNTESYYPLPNVKAKLIESFVELIFDTKSMMVSSSKKPSR